MFIFRIRNKALTLGERVERMLELELQMTRKCVSIYRLPTTILQKTCSRGIALTERSQKQGEHFYPRWYPAR